MKMDKDMKMKKGWRQNENGYGRNEELANGFLNGSKMAVKNILLIPYISI